MAPWRRVAGLYPRQIWLLVTGALGLAALAYLAPAVQGQIELSRQYGDLPLVPGPKLNAIITLPVVCLLACLLSGLLAMRAGPTGTLVQAETDSGVSIGAAWRAIAGVIYALSLIAFGLAEACLFFAAGYWHFVSYFLAAHGDKLSTLARHTAGQMPFFVGIVVAARAALAALAGVVLLGLAYVVKRAGRHWGRG